MPVLLDTGILLRMFVPADPHCPAIREALKELLRTDERIYTSAQNLAEFVNVSTRPATARGGYAFEHGQVLERVRFIERICHVITESNASYSIWKTLVQKYQVSGVSIHDARLAATMLSMDISHILTLNTSDFVRYHPEGISLVELPHLVSD